MTLASNHRILSGVRGTVMLMGLGLMACELAPVPGSESALQADRASERTPELASEQASELTPEPIEEELGDPAPQERLLIARALRRSTLELWLDHDGVGHLRLRMPGRPPSTIPCDVLNGAWGLWVDDIDGDGRAEAIVALHKRARFDPEPANRLHVYGFEQGRCVPAWRGTRLAGRFDAVATNPEEPGTLEVHEWLSPTRRRVARYRWQGFGYRVEEIRWEGEGNPPRSVLGALDFGPSPITPSQGVGVGVGA